MAINEEKEQEYETEDTVVFFYEIPVNNVKTQERHDKRVKFTRLLILDYCLYVSLLVVIFWYFTTLYKRVEEDK